MLGKVSEVLDITRDDLKQAILKDDNKTLDNYLQASNANKDAENEATADKREEVLPFAATGPTDWRQAS